MDASEKEDRMDKAIVIFSGGQDSTTCLMWAISKVGEANVFPLSFFYGQRHEVELTQAREICRQLNVKQPEFMSAVQLQSLGGAALTDKRVEPNVDATGTGNKYAEDHGLPSTFVPGRNMLFLTLATAYGAKLGIYNLVTGVCEADDAGYPDCRSSFVSAAEVALSKALDETVEIHAPLLRRSKAETFKLASDLGGLETILKHTHTCYRGERHLLYEWGYGCGECGACVERAKGWTEFKEMEIAS